jgi:hypothetical protein
VLQPQVVVAVELLLAHQVPQLLAVEPALPPLLVPQPLHPDFIPGRR